MGEGVAWGETLLSTCTNEVWGFTPQANTKWRGHTPLQQSATHSINNNKWHQVRSTS